MGRKIENGKIEILEGRKEGRKKRWKEEKIKRKDKNKRQKGKE